MKNWIFGVVVCLAVAGITMAQAPVVITPAPGRFPVVMAYGRSTAQTAAVASVASYTPGADGSFEVSANVLATTATTFSFVVEIAYTDESNTARTDQALFTLGAATVTTTVSNANGGHYIGIPVVIRAKAGTSITVRTQAAGTYTTVTYNVEGVIKQVQ